MKYLKLLLIFCLSTDSAFPMGIFPRRGLSANVSKVTSQLKDKNYTIEGSKRFHIGLKKNESVRYVVTVPVYLSKTAIGIATDENVKKVKIVLFTQLNKESKERSFFGEEIESGTYINEISEKSYHYVVELTLLDSTSNAEYSSVDLLVAHAPIPITTVQEVKDFYYDHTGEVEFYSDPIQAREAGWRRSDTGRVPCTASEYGRSCIR
jgi:hypothetical protein